MLDDDEKQDLPLSSTDNDRPQSIRLAPLYSVSERLKHFFPLVKSRSSSGLSSATPPTIVTTSPTTPCDPFIRNDVVVTERLSSSSIENNMQSSASSARTSSSIAANLICPSQTHLHVVTSSAVAVAIASNHIHFDDVISARSSDERPCAPQMSQIRTSSSSNCPSNETTPSATATLSNTEKFLQKILPSQLIRRSHQHRQKNNSVSSLPDQQQKTMTRSAPASPKLSAQSGTPLSPRSSNEDHRLQDLEPSPDLPVLQSLESLPVMTRPILEDTTPSSDIVSSPQRSPHRGRSSTVSSVSSDIAPRMSPSRSRRTTAIFNLKGRDSGQGTPIEKCSLDNDEDEGYMLPPPDNDSGEDYFQKLQAEEGGLSRCMRKLIESDDPIHSSALSAYLQTIPFGGYPLDMAMRYLLLHLPLPKEQGAIYRLLELFSRKYLACNPSLWDSHDQILVVCYSMLMLNTDAWNTNNKIKMTREQYIRNTSGQGASEDILSCWYDNITLTPFIDSTHPTLSKLRLSQPAVVDRPTRPMLDTYTPLLESRLEELKIVYSTKGRQFTRAIENSLHYTGTLSTIPVEEIHSHVESATRVTVIGSRSRGKSEGFALSRFGLLPTLNGESSRLVKVGVFPRCERISRFGRVGGWHWIETGVLLLDSKLLFIKGDLSLVKLYLMSQEINSETVIPPLGSEVIFELTGAIAFYDSRISGPTDYTLRLVSQHGDSDVLGLPNEDVLNEWIGLINYLATIQSALSLPQDTDSSSISPALLRRRAGTMAPAAGRQVPLRAVSSTLDLRGRSRSEQPPPLPNSSLDKILIYSTFQKELEAKLHLEKAAVDALLRQARGLLMQTPLQERTRIIVLSALERVVKRLKTSRIELERSVCYIDVLSQIIAITGERKIRIVEDDATTAEEFQLPSLGFHGNHRKCASDDTADTMLSSTTLYTALSPGVDIGVPMRRIGTPTRNAKTIQPTLREGSKSSMSGKRSMSGGDLVGFGVGGQSSIVHNRELGVENYDSTPESMETERMSPGCLDTRGTPDSLRAENESNSRIDEVSRVMREGGF